MIFKKILLPISFIFCFSIYCSAQNFGGNPPALKWRQINNKTVRVIFPVGLDSQANRINNMVTLLDSSTLPTIGNQSRKWNIVLLNQTTIPNAYVRLSPVISELNMLPAQDNFSNGSLRWDDNLIIHENRHMQQFASFNTGLTKVFSFLLGQQGQLLANGLTIPDYFFEGDAVWQETLVSNQGRGRLPSFFNGFKALQLGNKNYSWMKLRSGSLKAYTPDHYQLGYQLVAYGIEKYGADFWKKVTTDAVHFKGLFYPFNKAIETASGKPYNVFRADALQYFSTQIIPGQNTRGADLNWLSPIKKNTVADYLFPVFIHDDTILVTKKSYKTASAFYLIVKGKEQRLRMKDQVIDDYFSYNNGRIVYASYQSDPRWANRNYSVIKLLNIYTQQQRQLSFRSKYFSPDINTAGTELLAVNVEVTGGNNLHRINALNGKLIVSVPNPHHYFFTQTKYIDSINAVAAVRNPAGQMAIIRVNINTGEAENLTPFTYNVVGNPVVKGDTVYYGSMDISHTVSDKIFAVSLTSKKMYRLTDNENGIYQPAVNSKGVLLFAAFTADGTRLAKIEPAQLNWQPVVLDSQQVLNPIAINKAVKNKAAGILYQLADSINQVSPYKKTFQFFNFHSARPMVNDPEYGYTFYSDNILSSFSNNLTYTYNRNDRSHTLGFNAVFAGWFPVLSMGVDESFNRNVDTAFGRSVQYNAAKLHTSINIPLSFIGGRTSKFINFGGSYNVQQVYFRDNTKNSFGKGVINYGSTFLSFSNVSRQALQNINPRWAQTFSVNYNDAFNFRNSHKLLTTANLYLPGLFANHSIVINGAYQKRDSLPDLFNNNFPYSRGYQALSTRQMYKVGFNYHLPLLYPDFGFGNILFIQRIRANSFFDYTNARAKVNGTLANIKNRSAGIEMYFDTKLWNALPATFGFRFAHLLDRDYNNPGVKNRWEFIIPISIIPR